MENNYNEKERGYGYPEERGIGGQGVYEFPGSNPYPQGNMNMNMNMQQEFPHHNNQQQVYMPEKAYRPEDEYSQQRPGGPGQSVYQGGEKYQEQERLAGGGGHGMGPGMPYQGQGQPVYVGAPPPVREESSPCDCCGMCACLACLACCSWCCC
ncbi:hypothetical protein AYI69_g6561 [Smittium culicis]|uniref:Uncharacterized protein n=1 Tax=Smittium culicis TaxID=133412 RepID=A0A1R1XYK6_9FUNG|nr:hypothetical protein AYI69_g6561 [Smittium culicis]